MDDEGLLEGLQKQDEQALRRAIETYGGYAAAAVRAAAGGALRDEDVEEAAAEAFVKLWRGAWRIDPRKGTLKAYLGAVCRNEARSRLRALRPVMPLEEDCLSPDEQTAEGRLEQRELEALTHAALDELDGTTREIFLRYYYRREKIVDIAAALGMNPSTVKNRLARGREKLHRKLMERGVTNEDVV